MNLTLSLAVREMDMTESFYKEVLGLDVSRVEVAPEHPPLLLLPLGDTVICFRDAAVIEAMHPALLQNMARHPYGVGVQFEIPVGNLERIIQRLEREEIRILYELDDEEFRRHEIWVHDPDGYLLVLMEEDSQES